MDVSIKKIIRKLKGVLIVGIACGDWKVYGDEESAKCLFCKYKRCREVYMSVYGAGRKFVDMLVSA